MDFAIRQQSPVGSDNRSAARSHKCPQCREQALILERRHVSPARLGAPLVTEYYDCDCCDARYQYSPGDNRWRPIYQ